MEARICLKSATLRFTRSSLLSSGLRRQASGYDEDVRVRRALVAARENALPAEDGGAVQEVERLPFGGLGVGVYYLYVGGQPLAFERVRGARAHAPAAADYRDLHFLSSEIIMFVILDTSFSASQS